MAIFNSLDAHNLPIFQPILMILVSKFMVHRALSDKTYLSFGLLSPLTVYLLSGSCPLLVVWSLYFSCACYSDHVTRQKGWGKFTTAYLQIRLILHFFLFIARLLVQSDLSITTLVNVYVDLVVFTRIACTS